MPTVEDGSLYAYFSTTIRVEVDPHTEEVVEVLIDEDLMRQPTMVLGLDGGPVPEAVRDHVASITSVAEWPSWDYGSVHTADGPAAARRSGLGDG